MRCSLVRCACTLRAEREERARIASAICDSFRVREREKKREERMCATAAPRVRRDDGTEKPAGFLASSFTYRKSGVKHGPARPTLRRECTNERTNECGGRKMPTCVFLLFRFRKRHRAAPRRFFERAGPRVYTYIYGLLSFSRDV